MSRRLLKSAAAILGLLAWSIASPPAHAGETRSIAGEWRVRLDPDQVGESARWFEQDLDGRIALPGSTDVAGLGPANTAPHTLDGLYRLHPYQGPVWFQYDLMIPASWKGKRVRLVFERAHGETRVWIDGQELPDRQDSLVAPHIHELGPLGTPGTKRVTVLVDNTPAFDLGRFVSVRYEGTQTNWNGLIGALELQAVDPVSIESISVYPTDVPHGQARVRVELANTTGQTVQATLRLNVRPARGSESLASLEAPVTLDQPRVVIERDLTIGPGAKPWDEFAPNLYQLDASLDAREADLPCHDEASQRFGLREARIEGTQFALNGRTIQLRGTLECAIFPKTGYPPTDPASWRRICRILKAHGLNFLRFHSWCPPEAAFAAADAEGVYLQVEGPQANVNVGQNPARDAFVEQELLRIVRTYGHHPSFLLMTLGNEFGGDDAILSRWVDQLQKADGRHFYSSPSFGQKTANRQFTEDLPRGVQGSATDRDFRNELASADRPIIGHEIGQWTFFPDFNEIPRYDGVLAPRNFDLIRDDLKAKGMLDLAPAFVQATGHHATLLYKEEIELLLRTPRYAGFSLLDLHDYPGQGTALVGILDPFWNSKGFVSPDVHRQYCGPTVPLARLPKRIYTSDETLDVVAEVAHYGPANLPATAAVWSLTDPQGRTIERGALPPVDLPTGGLRSLGSFHTSLAGAPSPSRLVLRIELPGTPFANQWDLWVYPATPGLPEVPQNVVLSRSWDQPTRDALAQGRSVVLVPAAVNPAHSLPGRFLPVFWSPIWFPDQVPNTMGILCDPSHPALGCFPTEAHANWQWSELLDHSQSLILDDLPPVSVTPIVRVVDNFARNHQLANVVECRVGPGRLLICTIDLLSLAPANPAARQLLASLLAHAASPAFQPEPSIDPSLLDSRLVPPPK
jgi:hypothetical protein